MIQQLTLWARVYRSSIVSSKKLVLTVFGSPLEVKIVDTYQQQLAVTQNGVSITILQEKRGEVTSTRRRYQLISSSSSSSLSSS